MTYQEKLAEVKRIVQDANPNLLEETMGFEFLYNERIRILLVNRGGCVEYATEGCNWIDRFEATAFNKCDKLGHPITLENVIITLRKGFGETDKNIPGRPILDLVAVEETCCLCVDGMRVSGNLHMWIFGKILDDQPEPTIDWLYETLRGKV